MKKFYLLLAVLFLCVLSFRLLCAETGCGVGAAAVAAPAYDVNKDGKPDVTYTMEGTSVAKVEADTNYDGKADVAVQIKDGQFVSAEADTDHNGTMDRQFNDQAEFVKWLNQNSPEFEKYLNQKDWNDPAVFRF